MNFKLIIIWFIAVVILAGIGLYGMANQDLLDELRNITEPDDETQYSGTYTYHCNAVLDNGISTYSFKISDDTNEVVNVSITYQSTSPLDYIYNSANNLKDASVAGITTNLTGSENDFILIINANPQNYNGAALYQYKDDLKNVNAVIENLGSIENYESAINKLVEDNGSVYNCN